MARIDVTYKNILKIQKMIHQEVGFETNNNETLGRVLDDRIFIPYGAS